MLKQFPSILICEVVYICKAENKYINLAKISLVILVIRKAAFGNFVVPANNTLVCHMSIVYLAADTCTTVCLDYTHI